MAVTLKKAMQALPAHQRDQVEARATALIAEELTLQSLRKANHEINDDAILPSQNAKPVHKSSLAKKQPNIP